MPNKTEKKKTKFSDIKRIRKCNQNVNKNFFAKFARINTEMYLAFLFIVASHIFDS